MAARRSRRLVIDASVARSAGGEEASYPRSKFCRDFLKSTLEICHHVIMTSEIQEEWRQHRSKFTQQWLVSMQARKKVHHIGDAVDNELRGRIEHASSQAKEYEREAMRKDYRLVEAAIATVRVVISLDEKVRKLFAVATREVGELRFIVWVNPERLEEEPMHWLENGARADRKRLLRVRAEGVSKEA